MSDVKVFCEECGGEGVVESIHDPIGGYGPYHTEPDYRSGACEECDGNGYQEMTRAELLAKNIEKHEAKVRPIREALNREWERRRSLAREEALNFAARVAELV